MVKALALGADAVGLGKPAVFSMSAYGEDGIVKMLDLLRDEVEKCMRLIGAPSLADLNPRLVDSKSLSLHSDQAPIPPSPYVWTPPPKLVRSPEFPTTAQTRDKLMEQIAELENQLAKMDGQKRHAVPECLAIFFKLLKVIVVSLLSTVFASSKSGSLHRSAVFLIVFLVGMAFLVGLRR